MIKSITLLKLTFRQFSLMFMSLLMSSVSSMAYSENSLFKYNTYNYSGWETPESGYSFGSGVSALTELGETHWNGLHGNSYYYFRTLVNPYCNSSNNVCWARPQYERCYVNSGMSPATRGKWKYASFNLGGWETDESGYVFGNGTEALNALGSTYWSGTHGNSTYYFVGLYQPNCNASSCSSRYTYERCYGDTSPGTKGKWKYNSYTYPGTNYPVYWTSEESDYAYGDGFSALEALGQAHFSGVHGNASYTFISLLNFQCNPGSNPGYTTYSNCWASPKFEACDLDTGQCQTYTPLIYMSAAPGDCLEYTPGNVMTAREGSCSISTPLSNMTASSQPSQYYLSGANGFNDCENQSCGRQCSSAGVPKEGNPISVSGGNKYQLEVDFAGAGTGPLTLKRHYNSFPSKSAAFDQSWSHDYSAKLVPEYTDIYMPRISAATESTLYSSPQSACLQGFRDIEAHLPELPDQDRSATFENGSCKVFVNSKYYGSLPVYNNTGGGRVNLFSDELELIALTLWRPDGNAYRFYKDGGNQWVPDSHGVPGKLTQLGDGGYEYSDGLGNVEHYTSSGQLSGISYLNGASVDLTYDDYARLLEVKDQAGRSLTFTYDSDSRIDSVTLPDSGVLHYTYDSKDRLTGVTYPAGSNRQYLYDDPNHPVGLSGIINENGNRFASWAYDGRFRAILSEHADGTDRVTLDYQDEEIVHVTEPLGNEKTYHLDRINGSLKMTSVDGGVCQTCGGATKQITYDSNGFAASRVDSKGNTTTYVRDESGLELSRTEAFGTPQARTITTEWHSQYRKPVRITEPDRIVEYTYDSAGRLLNKTERALP